MVRWLRWHCPPDTGFEIRALAVWGRACYLSVIEAPHNTDFHTWMWEKHFCFFQTAETGNRTPNSGVKGSGANHYPIQVKRKERKKTFMLIADWKKPLDSMVYITISDQFPWNVFWFNHSVVKIYWISTPPLKFGGGGCDQTFANLDAFLFYSH